MAQKYYEYVHYKEEHVQEQRRAPRGACNAYVIVFQTIFYACFHVSASGRMGGTGRGGPRWQPPALSLFPVPFHVP